MRASCKLRSSICEIAQRLFPQGLISWRTSWIECKDFWLGSYFCSSYVASIELFFVGFLTALWLLVGHKDVLRQSFLQVMFAPALWKQSKDWWIVRGEVKVASRWGEGSWSCCASFIWAWYCQCSYADVRSEEIPQKLLTINVVGTTCFRGSGVKTSKLAFPNRCSCWSLQAPYRGSELWPFRFFSEFLDGLLYEKVTFSIL